MTRPRLEPTINNTWGGHTHHYTYDITEIYVASLNTIARTLTQFHSLWFDQTWAQTHDLPHFFATQCKYYKKKWLNKTYIIISLKLVTNRQYNRIIYLRITQYMYLCHTDSQMGNRFFLIRWIWMFSHTETFSNSNICSGRIIKTAGFNI